MTSGQRIHVYLYMEKLYIYIYYKYVHLCVDKYRM